MTTLDTTEYSKRGIRHNRILTLLSKNSAMSNYDLCNELGCSEATIRNDLRALDKAGLIMRTRGGATKAIDQTPSPLDNFPQDSRVKLLTDEKQAIADFLLASDMIKPNMSIAIDIGSTCYIAAKKISEIDFPLGVAASSLGIANMLAHNPHIKLALAGGFYYSTIDAFDTTSSLNLFSNMYFDYYFMGANGVSKAGGVTCTMMDQENRMPVKRLIASHSQKTVLLCDHTKINKTYMHGICSLKEISYIITDDRCSDAERQSFIELDAPVYFAPIHK